MVRVVSFIRSRAAASTLVEVLVALVILLTIFGMGMIIFARLNQAGSSQKQQQVGLRLRQIGHAYAAGEWDAHQPVNDEQISYAVNEEPLATYADRRRVTVYAFDNEQQKLVDSLALILPLDEN